jgi:iron complex outermembrane receptor protein
VPTPTPTSTATPVPDARTAPVVVHAEGDRPADTAARRAARALDEPAFVSQVFLDDDLGLAEPTGQILARQAGISARSLGGLGAFSSISVRGAPSAQTLVLVDGVPLSRVGFAGIDLGAMDGGSFERVDIYRGGVPAEWGGAALGGAINFVTGVGPSSSARPLRLVLAGGSFGARRVGLARRDRWSRGWASTVVASYAGAAGDYDYFDDNGTPLEPGDDHQAARLNNGYDQADLVGRARRRGAGQILEAGVRLAWKRQGVPGPSGVAARHTSLTTARVIADGRAAKTGLWGQPELRLSAGLHAAFEDQRYRDRDGEVGLGQQDAHYLTAAAGGVLAASTIARGHRVSALAQPSFEWFRHRDDLAAEVAARGTRFGLALAVDDEIAFGPNEAGLVVPAVRLDLLSTRPSGPGSALPDPSGGGSGSSAMDTTVMAWSPRLAARWALRPDLALKASAGRYFRAPTLVELYGDRGVLVGNPALSAETGGTVDLGVVWAPKRPLGGADRIFVEAAGFFGRSTALIAWVPTSGRASVAKNLGAADLWGVELGVETRLGRLVTLAGNYTFLATAQDSPLVPYDQKALPGRPRHELYLRASGESAIGPLRLGLAADLTAQSGTWLDQGNLNAVPARRLVGAELRLSWRRITFGLDARNLFDARTEDVPLVPAPRPDLTSAPRAVADALGHPLPGRSLLATVTAEL